ncbi:AlbA family DNA-binding domain-containing protein [Allorhodopirellula solitaria]|uniref:Divergent AAA domain protein n=1 Tax=Allorhodopirellula solitaria TaxID=2527987 RepID=A0A5C5XXS9_9BACT|nr:ATP-binding protein [Allorhodopirellula solitaria]TWT67321.1 Divergent AAA domain protein [Allorhodopirellula solitaria]
MSHIDITNIDTLAIPFSEDDEFEFKSSATPHKELGKKIACAVSGFANAGGGVFIAGVDANGDPDGGFAPQVGRQDLRDWVDQIVHQVTPTPSYEIKLLDDAQGRGTLNSGCSVVAIAIEESFLGPHMASDNKYYIRAGAHTVPARHFIVEAIWAKRHYAKPRLTHLFRTKPTNSQSVQLGILALTSSPAVDIKINLAPLGELLARLEQYFPLRVPVIDSEHPFFFDVSTWTMMKDRFGENVELDVNYHDLMGNSYQYKTVLDIEASFGPMRLDADAAEKVAKSLESIDKSLKSRK